jgi:hypothetical protein
LVPIQLGNNYSCSGNMNKKLLNYTVKKINTVVAKIIPQLNYLVGSNLIKELNLNLNNF